MKQILDFQFAVDEQTGRVDLEKLRRTIDYKRHYIFPSNPPVMCASVTSILKPVYDQSGLSWWQRMMLLDMLREMFTSKPDRTSQFFLHDDKFWPHKRKDLIMQGNDYSSEARNFGTLVHDIAECRYLERQPSGYLKAKPRFEEASELADLVLEYLPWVEHTEVAVFSPQAQYAGTIDMYHDGIIYDIKTGSLHDSHALQAAAYAEAQFLVTGEGFAIPMPEVQEAKIIHVNVDTGLQVKDVDLDTAKRHWWKAIDWYQTMKEGKVML